MTVGETSILNLYILTLWTFWGVHFKNKIQLKVKLSLNLEEDFHSFMTSSKAFRTRNTFEQHPTKVRINPHRIFNTWSTLQRTSIL